MDCSPPGSPVRGIFQARVLEWVAIQADIKLNIWSPGFTHTHTHTQGLSTGGDSSPQGTPLAMSGDILECHSLRDLLASSEWSREMLLRFYKTQDSPHSQEILGPNPKCQ